MRFPAPTAGVGQLGPITADDATRTSPLHPCQPKHPTPATPALATPLTRAFPDRARSLSAVPTGCNLSSTNLYSADLSGAILEEAVLEGADLTEANLTDANLSHADLTGANLDRANMYGADLSVSLPFPGGPPAPRTGDYWTAEVCLCVPSLAQFGACTPQCRDFDPKICPAGRKSLSLSLSIK